MLKKREFQTDYTLFLVRQENGVWCTNQWIQDESTECRFSSDALLSREDRPQQSLHRGVRLIWFKGPSSLVLQRVCLKVTAYSCCVPGGRNTHRSAVSESGESNVSKSASSVRLTLSTSFHPIRIIHKGNHWEITHSLNTVMCLKQYPVSFSDSDLQLIKTQNTCSQTLGRPTKQDF